MSFGIAKMLSPTWGHDIMPNFLITYELFPITSKLCSQTEPNDQLTIQLLENKLPISHTQENCRTELTLSIRQNDNKMNDIDELPCEENENNSGEINLHEAYDFQIPENKLGIDNSYLPIKRKSSKKSKFTDNEDQRLQSLVMKYGTNNWKLIAKQIPNRTPRQCRDRYRHYLSPTINQSEWTKEEDRILLEKTEEFGFKWKVLENFFSNRNEIQIRNRYYSISRVGKKRKYKHIMNKFQIDPIHYEEELTIDFPEYIDDNEFIF